MARAVRARTSARTIRSSPRMREISIYDKAFDERKVRRAIAAYFGLVSFLDHNVGRIMDAVARKRARRRARA